jgi:hypothetical protein
MPRYFNFRPRIRTGYRGFIIMANKEFEFKSGNQLSYQSLLIWRIVQSIVWAAGITILFCLIFFPSTGILLFWNILIPVAPALLVLATGVWRNVCPLATTNLFPRHFRWSRGKKLSARQLGKLNLVAVLALYVIVPMRHAMFNVNGPATAALIASMAFTGFGLGFIYEWKSVWCSGLCPIHPVEKLYGGNVFMPVPNAHCGECMNCVIPCPDSTPNMNPNISGKNVYQRASAFLIIGGLPGFIWGWFHVPDGNGGLAIRDMVEWYTFPFLGLVATLVIYGILSKSLPTIGRKKLIAVFAAAAVSCYYWYRIPSLFGFGQFAHDGLLVDLKTTIPAWLVRFITITLSLFFLYWMVFRKANSNSWLIRPRFAAGKEENIQTGPARSRAKAGNKY